MQRISSYLGSQLTRFETQPTCIHAGKHPHSSSDAKSPSDSLSSRGRNSERYCAHNVRSETELRVKKEKKRPPTVIGVAPVRGPEAAGRSRHEAFLRDQTAAALVVVIHA